MDTNDPQEWKDWRTGPIRNYKPIAGATWNKEVAVLSPFFRWAQKKAETLEFDASTGSNRSGLGSGPMFALKGYAVATTDSGKKLIGADEDPAFRGRNTHRNATFVETVYRASE